MGGGGWTNVAAFVGGASQGLGSALMRRNEAKLHQQEILNHQKFQERMAGEDRAFQGNLAKQKMAADWRTEKLRSADSLRNIAAQFEQTQKLEEIRANIRINRELPAETAQKKELITAETAGRKELVQAESAARSLEGKEARQDSLRLAIDQYKAQKAADLDAQRQGLAPDMARLQASHDAIIAETGLKGEEARVRMAQRIQREGMTDRLQEAYAMGNAETLTKFPLEMLRLAAQPDESKTAMIGMLPLLMGFDPATGQYVGEEDPAVAKQQLADAVADLYSSSPADLTRVFAEAMSSADIQNPEDLSNGNFRKAMLDAITKHQEKGTGASRAAAGMRARGAADAAGKDSVSARLSWRRKPAAASELVYRTPELVAEEGAESVFQELENSVQGELDQIQAASPDRRRVTMGDLVGVDGKLTQTGERLRAGLERKFRKPRGGPTLWWLGSTPTIAWSPKGRNFYFKR